MVSHIIKHNLLVSFWQFLVFIRVLVDRSCQTRLVFCTIQVQVSIYCQVIAVIFFVAKFVYDPNFS
jgi:hypothetical protein